MRSIAAPGATRADRVHLARAVALAERARVVSSPNPPVGCVLVRDGRVVGEGATAAVGGPHAEATALAAAGGAAAGATAFATLEPCAHRGRTPSCADALRQAGVARVVYGLDDPHPLARGGARVLAGAGVEVVGGVLAEWVAVQLEGFLATVRRGRPHVTCKLAQTVDGRLVVGDRTGQEPGRRWLTGPRARTAVHRLRAAADAVLVGSGTVLADDPRLDVRHVPARGRPPRPVVLDGRLRTPPEARVVRPGAIVCTTADADPSAVAALERRGAEVRVVARGPDGRLDLPAALAALAERGVTSVLAEPGPTLATALVRAGLADRLVLHVALDLGRGPLRPAVAPDLVARWDVERVGGAGEDLVLHLRPPSGSPTDGDPAYPRPEEP